jgi:hypothetical protein
MNINQLKEKDMKFNKTFTYILLILFFVPITYMSYNWYQSRVTYKEIPSNVIDTLTNLQVSEPVCLEEEVVNFAFYDDKPVNFSKNNKYGLYIYAERQDFFEIASELVNSNGGAWGYVLIPYNVKDRDYSKWKRVFADLNRLKLIPVIQLWDVDLDKYEKQTKDAAKFLNKFDWPVKYLYISAYNEVNDQKFWYGKVDPQKYARVLDFTIKEFKKVNPNFLIMNGAFNITAPTDKNHMDAFLYMSYMNKEVPGIFNKLDAWASHSYPQPNFSGNPLTIGRWGIRAYDEELKFLKNGLGVTKELPVFITETGWAHAEGQDYNSRFLPEEIVSKYFEFAFTNIWLPDDRVRAVMPFTIWYEPPFDHFSWIREDKTKYQQFEVIKNLSKVKGEPPFLIKGSYRLEKCE